MIRIFHRQIEGQCHVVHHHRLRRDLQFGENIDLSILNSFWMSRLQVVHTTLYQSVTMGAVLLSHYTGCRSPNEYDSNCVSSCTA